MNALCNLNINSINSTNKISYSSGTRFNVMYTLKSVQVDCTIKTRSLIVRIAQKLPKWRERTANDTNQEAPRDQPKNNKWNKLRLNEQLNQWQTEAYLHEGILRWENDWMRKVAAIMHALKIGEMYTDEALIHIWNRIFEPTPLLLLFICWWMRKILKSFVLIFLGPGMFTLLKSKKLHFPNRSSYITLKTKNRYTFECWS